MIVFKVSFYLIYPECDQEELNVAYVLAVDFKEAQRKVEKFYKEEYQSADIKKIEILNAKIIV